jgi:ribosomal protein S18 acetylase RimI-like enzyme
MTEEEFIYRKALPADNDKLIDLARRCPMKGQFEMYTDRNPDFFATNRVQGERAHIYLAERPSGEVVGCVAYTEKVERRGDKDVKVLHIGDLRTDPSLRRTKIAATLIEIYRKMLYSGDYDHGMVEILEGNKAAVSLNNLLGEDFVVGTEGHIRFYQLLPVRSYWLPKAFNYRQATLFDLPAIASLMQKAYGGFPGAPNFTPDWIKKQFAKHPSFQISNMYVATDKDQNIVASAGLWDQSSFRRTVASRFNSSMKRTVRLMTFFGLMWKLPPVPREGKALNYLFIRWPVSTIENLEALAGLNKFLLNRVRKEGKHQFLSVGFNEHDPLQASLEGMTKLKENIQVFSHWVKASDSYKMASAEPVQKRFVDLTLI